MIDAIYIITLIFVCAFSLIMHRKTEKIHAKKEIEYCVKIIELSRFIERNTDFHVIGLKDFEERVSNEISKNTKITFEDVNS